MNLDIDMSDFDKQYDEEMNRIKRVCRMNFQKVGETYIATARDAGNYKDRTGNLRNAHGYGISDEGTIVSANTGRPETLDGIRQQPQTAELECICGDGMDYASKLEGKGYDVSSSGFLAAENEAKRLFK